jgi:hypothetical protein
MPNATISDIPHLVKALNLRKGNHSTVLLIGSRAGGLFRSKQLYETLKQFGEPSFHDLPRIQQFAQCYHLLTRKTDPGFGLTDIDSILTSALKDVDITDADICLAELVKIGLFDIIITTNVDNILEDSLEYVGLKEMHHFEVFSLRAHARRDQLRFEKRGSCRIVKVFGQLTAREYTIRRSGYLHQNLEIKQRLEELLTRDIIAIGMDPVWDAELYLAFQAPGDSFWFINEENLNEDSHLSHVGEVRNYKHLTGEAYNYEYFIQILYEAFLKTLPAGTFDGYNVNASILRELYKLRREMKYLREEVQNIINHHE